MSSEPNLAGIPPTHHDALAALAQTVRDVFGAELLALTAFGGWLVGDPFYADNPARCVLVLRQIDLKALDRLAQDGAKLGRMKLAAPLVMTPEYIRASCDTFPLELLEIQQLHQVVLGADHFAGLKLAPADLRHECERELKSELVQLRQGLMAAAGRHKLLDADCRRSGERVVRILRGIVHLGGNEPPRDAAALVRASAGVTNSPLQTLGRLMTAGAHLGFEGFSGLYGDVQELALYVDGLAIKDSNNPGSL